jgi:hypothetical protein
MLNLNSFPFGVAEGEAVAPGVGDGVAPWALAIAAVDVRVAIDRAQCPSFYRIDLQLSCGFSTEFILCVLLTFTSRSNKATRSALNLFLKTQLQPCQLTPTSHILPKGYSQEA